MGSRSWRWLRLRIKALLDIPPQVTAGGSIVQTTRLGHALYPPTSDDKT